MVELKARFDEQRNIDGPGRSSRPASTWSTASTLKIHAKTTLVIRRRERPSATPTSAPATTTPRPPACTRTWGCSPPTPEITDVADLFNFLTGFGRPQRFRKIRRRRSTYAASWWSGYARSRRPPPLESRPGSGSRSTTSQTPPSSASCNGLQAGVEIDRSPWAVRADPRHRGRQRPHPRALDPGSVPRKHSRHPRLEAGDTKSYLLGSADLMQRNLDHRIEMLVPVEAPHVRRGRDDPAPPARRSNLRVAWSLGSDGGWRRLALEPGERRRGRRGRCHAGPHP